MFVHGKAAGEAGCVARIECFSFLFSAWRNYANKMVAKKGENVEKARAGQKKTT